MSTRIVAASLCLTMAGQCFAQAPTATARIETGIPPQALGSALKELAKTRHVEVLFLTTDVKDLRTPGASGRSTLDETLAELLRGTGLTYRYVDFNAVSIIRSSRGTDGKANTSATEKSRSRVQTKSAPANSDTDPSGTTVPKPSKRGEVKDRKAAALQEVTITGTHIIGAEALSPVTIVTSQQIKDSGLPDVASVVRTLPQDFSGGPNPDVNVGGGINGGNSLQTNSTVNLRGIGPDATLTLLDGHRLSSSELGSYVDLSMIPTAAVERIEVETGGASAIYGADAVAGVVNIILRKSYQGQQTDAYVGGTTDGGLVQRYSQLVGDTFSGGDAGMMLGYQFQSEDEILASQRPVSRAAGSKTGLTPQEKSHSLFLAAHYDAGNLRSHIDGVYNHRTSLLLEAGNSEQALEDQFSIDGGLTWNAGQVRTFGLDAIWTGDSGTGVVYIPAAPTLGNVVHLSLQNRETGIEFTEQGELFQLPGKRIIRSALGAGFTEESFDQQQFRSSTPPVIASRREEHGYGEFTIPIVTNVKAGPDRLTVSAAARFEHYGDFGAATMPNIGVGFSPVSEITLSGVWGKSFSAPTLYDTNGGIDLERYPGSVFRLPPGREVLEVSGANPNLKPERATTQTVTIQWRPQFRPLQGMSGKVSYWDIDFKGRITPPFSGAGLASVLTNPLYAPFIIDQPSAALQSAELVRAVAVFNLAPPVSPADVQALLLNQESNLSRQVIHGVDATLSDQWSGTIGRLTAEITGSFERFDQQLLPGAGLQKVDGTIFNPASFKSRATLAWTYERLGVSLFVNHIDGELNTAVTPWSRVNSWTTIDGQARYIVDGLELRLSVQNILNSAPPTIPALSTVPRGMGFDPDNYSAIGRFLSLEASVDW